MIRIDRRDEAALIRSAPGTYTDREVAGLPGPVRRFFAAAIAPGTPLAQSAQLEMRGRVKIGTWLPFRAIELLSPLHGFVWAARAAGIISGADRFVDGRGGMNWKLAGVIPVMRAEGPDVSRSAAQRGAAEAVWVPTTLLPRFGVEWSASNDGHATARYRIGGHPIAIDCTLTKDGRVESVVFQRWGDPDGTGRFGDHVFGGDFSEYATFEGVTIPSAGRLGWHYGTDRWEDGEFFRFHITGLTLLPAGAGRE